MLGIARRTVHIDIGGGALGRRDPGEGHTV